MSAVERQAKKILVVDDEAKITEVVRAYLEKAGYSVVSADNGPAALELFERESPDLVVLDLMLPGLSGEEVCRRLRQRSRVPVIMLTAKAREQDKLDGFGYGADDYLTKPFSPRELTVRVGSLLRRCAGGDGPLFDKMSWNDGDLEINFSAMTVTRRGQPVALTPVEYKLLALMARHPGRVYSREQLIQNALGDDFDGFDRTIDAHVKNLRGKLRSGDSDAMTYIWTVRGTGYRFSGEQEALS